jgi:SAM-dependent methyltransferase
LAIARKKTQRKLPRRPSHSRKIPGNDGYSQFDLEWNDEGLFPEVVYPDAEFLFRRMNEATRESVGPKRGEVILDIGCGRGIDGAEMARRSAVVIGLEPSPIMIRHARKYISENGDNMSLVRGVGENLPFRAKSADKVMCKGALDHFPEPAVVIEQMAMVLKPGGKVIIAIANFDSLGFKLGRAIWRLRKMLGFKPHEGRMLWEIPEDHTRSFDYSFLKHLVDKCLKLEKVSGVSLFFGVPWWGIFLARLPRNVSTGILNSLDKMARHFPSMSDVVVMRCTSK